MSALPSKSLKVFLCHCNEDKPIVSKIHYHLIKTGCDSWLDAGKILGGQDWELEIQKEIRKADVFIIFLSKNSIGKEGFIQKEIRLALDIEEEKPEGVIFIIPILLDECGVPHRLTRWQYLNINQEGFWRKLVDSLNARAGQIGKDLLEFLDTPSIYDHLPRAGVKSKPVPEKSLEQKISSEKKEELGSFIKFLGIRLVSVMAGLATAIPIGTFISDDYLRHDSSIPSEIIKAEPTFILLILLAAIGSGFAIDYLDARRLKNVNMPVWFGYLLSAITGCVTGVLIYILGVFVIFFITVIFVIIINIVIPFLVALVVVVGIIIFLIWSWLQAISERRSLYWSKGKKGLDEESDTDRGDTT
jgi:hypothetical protein